MWLLMPLNCLTYSRDDYSWPSSKVADKLADLEVADEGLGWMESKEMEEISDIFEIRIIQILTIHYP